MKNKITIATRESLLALWQAHYVENRMKEQYPGLSVELLPVTTKGDQILDRPLVEIGGKGLFIKELEVILLEKKADIAVHSLKDMTAKCPDGLTIAAVTKREDPRDAFVSNTFKSLDELPHGARVGTSSLRRQAQLLHWRPDLTIRSLRGNVQTSCAIWMRGILTLSFWQRRASSGWDLETGSLPIFLRKTAFLLPARASWRWRPEVMTGKPWTFFLSSMTRKLLPVSVPNGPSWPG